MAMAGHASSSLRLTYVFLIILIATPTSSCLSFSKQYRALVSLGQSLMMRVANLRESRGDHAGADRARAVAEMLERGRFGLFKMVLSTGWDYLKNYAWREMDWGELHDAVSEMKDLLIRLTQLNGMDSEAKRSVWMGRNYQSILKASNSIVGKLLGLFRRSGTIREVVRTVKKEVEGGLLRDCLEVGSNDLKGLLQVLYDLLSDLPSASASNRTAEL